ncbi:MAG: tetratricopeptide repeat protein [Prevotellaceae bacterium]|jgi:tetratricopeptide (TPR) repeat protein|nr:tetratricopeptide repeat protein [Prevotellaceae bacterium]
MQKNSRYPVYLLILSILLLSSCVAGKRSVLPPPQVKTLDADEQRLRDYYFYEAIRLKEQYNYDEAIETLLLCAAIDPDDAGIQAELGIMYSLAGLKEEAAFCLEKAAGRQPANRWYNIQLISLYSDQAKWDDAIRNALVLQRHHPDREDVYPILATLYTQKGEAEKAVEAYDKLENFTGINEQLSLEKFRLYLTAGKETKAVAEIDRLVAKYPGESRYRVLQGNVYMHMNQKEKAFAIFQQVLQDDPQSPHVYLSLSEYYASVNETKKALESIESALQSPLLDIDTKVGILGEYIEGAMQDSAKHEGAESLLKLLIEYYPLEEQVYAYYAIFLQFDKRYDEAVEILETMLTINPKNEQTWGEIIQLYFGQKNYGQMLLATERAIENLPGFAQWYFYQGLALFQQEKYREAINAYNQGVELVPEKQPQFKSDFYSQMADSYFKLQEKEKAFEMYENALKINPSNIYVLNNYAYYLSQEKQDLKKAERMSAKTIEKEPDNSTYLDTYAWIFYRQGNYSLAKFYIERALNNLKAEESSGILLDHYGDILWMLGEKEKAVETWRKASDAGETTGEVKGKIEKGISEAE